MSEDIDARRSALEAEAGPLRARLREIDAEIEWLRREAGRRARAEALAPMFAEQVDEVSASWAAYLQGARKTTLVPTREGPCPVDPLYRRGLWVVHESVECDETVAVTLGPIGMRGPTFNDTDAALYAAERLDAATPDGFDPTSVAPPNLPPKWMHDAARDLPGRVA